VAKEKHALYVHAFSHALKSVSTLISTLTRAHEASPEHFSAAQFLADELSRRIDALSKLGKDDPITLCPTSMRRVLHRLFRLVFSRIVDAASPYDKIAAALGLTQRSADPTIIPLYQTIPRLVQLLNAADFNALMELWSLYTNHTKKSFDVTLPPNIASISVQAREDFLVIVIEELLLNAFHYCNETEPYIAFQLQIEGDQLKFLVENTCVNKAQGASGGIFLINSILSQVFKTKLHQLSTCPWTVTFSLSKNG
jgi:hypothetical protein